MGGGRSRDGEVAATASRGDAPESERDRDARGTSNNGDLRSRGWFQREDLDGFLHRSWLKAQGFTDRAFDGRPVIGICNSYSELVNCNAHLRDLAEAVRRGGVQNAGLPPELPAVAHRAA